MKKYRDTVQRKFRKLFFSSGEMPGKKVLPESNLFQHNEAILSYVFKGECGYSRS